MSTGTDNVRHEDGNPALNGPVDPNPIRHARADIHPKLAFKPSVGGGSSDRRSRMASLIQTLIEPSDVARALMRGWITHEPIADRDRVIAFSALLADVMLHMLVRTPSGAIVIDVRVDVPLSSNRSCHD